MSAHYSRLIVDMENNAEKFWDALQAELERSDVSEDIKYIISKIDPDKGVIVGSAALAAFEALACTLPGYEDGPVYARKPYLIQEVATRIAHFCEECGEEVDEYCSEHPNASIASTITPDEE